MRIFNSDPINFNSHNLKVRRADKIMRNTMNQTPVISTSRVLNYLCVQKKPTLKQKCQTKNKLLQQTRFDYKNIEEVYQGTLKTQVANCLEMAKITALAFLANGYTNLRIAKIDLLTNFRFSSGREENIRERIDHAMLVVEDENSELIVDPWLGFVEDLSNGLTRYDGVFMQGFRKAENVLGKMKQEFILRDVYEVNPDNKSSEYFAEKYPELVCNFTRFI